MDRDKAKFKKAWETRKRGRMAAERGLFSSTLLEFSRMIAWSQAPFQGKASTNVCLSDFPWIELKQSIVCVFSLVKSSYPKILAKDRTCLSPIQRFFESCQFTLVLAWDNMRRRAKEGISVDSSQLRPFLAWYVWKVIGSIDLPTYSLHPTSRLATIYRQIKAWWSTWMSRYRPFTYFVECTWNKNYLNQESSTISDDTRKESSSISTTIRGYVIHTRNMSFVQSSHITNHSFTFCTIIGFQPLTKNEIKRDSREIGKRSGFMVRMSPHLNPLYNILFFSMYPAFLCPITCVLAVCCGEWFRRWGKQYDQEINLSVSSCRIHYFQKT